MVALGSAAWAVVRAPSMSAAVAAVAARVWSFVGTPIGRVGLRGRSSLEPRA